MLLEIVHTQCDWGKSSVQKWPFDPHFPRIMSHALYPSLSLPISRLSPNHVNFLFFKSPQIHTLLKSEEWKCQSLSSDISNFWNPLPMPPGRTTGHSSTCFYSCSSSPHGHRDDLTAQHAPLRMKTAMHLNMSMRFYTVCSWPVSLPHPALLSPILSVQPHRPSLSLHTAALSSTISIHMGLSLWCWFSFP